MQSILQYRRFKKHLETQISHHTIDAVAGDCNLQPAPTETRGPYDAPRMLRFGASDSAEHPEFGNSAPADPDRPDQMILDDLPEQQQHNTNDEDLAEIITSPGVSTAPSREDEKDQPETPGQQIHDDLLAIATNLTTGTQFGRALTGINVRTRAEKEGGGISRTKVFVVGYQGPDDPLSPHNWSTGKRALTTILVSLIAFIVGYGSSTDSAVIEQASLEFRVSQVTESLATGLYLVGFGCGAFFAAPLSETVGRSPVYIVTLFFFMAFQMASALAPNIGAQLVCRFLAGLFGSTPLTTAGGSISDMWTAAERSVVFPLFANAAFSGPVLGPVVGAWIGQTGVLSWRWVDWVTLIWTGLIFLTCVLFMPETYGPTLLKWKALHLRHITRDERYRAEIEIRPASFSRRMLHNLHRPFTLFATEPIIVLISLYLTVVYVVLFTFFTGYGFIFGQTFGLSQGKTFLCLLAVEVGFCAASCLIPWTYRKFKRDLAAAGRAGRHQLPPESRLLSCMIGGPMIPLGLFWMAWTNFPSLGPWPGIVAGVPAGFGILTVFISSYQYLIDAYEGNAASALVGATFVRYTVAGGMIEVSFPMYRNLGVRWALTVLACLSLVMVPVPFVFYRYGPAIRKYSRFAVE